MSPSIGLSTGTRICIAGKSLTLVFKASGEDGLKVYLGMRYFRMKVILSHMTGPNPSQH